MLSDIKWRMEVYVYQIVEAESNYKILIQLKQHGVAKIKRQRKGNHLKIIFLGVFVTTLERRPEFLSHTSCSSSNMLTRSSCCET